MAHIQRLIWVAVGVLLAAVPMLSYANWYEITAVGSESGFLGECGSAGAQANQHLVGAGAAGDSAILQLVTANGVSAFNCEYSGPRTYTRVAGSAQFTTGNKIRLGYVRTGDPTTRYITFAWLQTPEEPVCETGQRDALGKCFQCPAGRVWNGTTCESPCEAKAGNSYGTTNSWAMLDVDTVPSGVPTFCDGSCSVTGGKVECESVSAGGTSGDRVSLGSTCTVQGPFTYTGQGCGPGGPAPMLVGTDDVQKPWWDKGLEQKDCSAQGGYWGNVNGIDSCVRPQPGETFDRETSTGNETSGTTETAADGTTTEKSTTTTTECKDGKCTTTTTTTTTTKGADGQQIGEATTETKAEVKPEADFCKANPQHAQCAGTKTGGSFSGGCTTGFACTGDAVQCAIARAAHTEACNQKAIADDAQGFMDGLGAVEPTDAKVAEALNRDGEFDFDIAEAFQDAQQNYVTFTASCLPPMGFTFKGQTYSFNTGFICEIGDFVRLMLHLIAYMTVLRVISRAFG